MSSNSRIFASLLVTTAPFLACNKKDAAHTAASMPTNKNHFVEIHAEPTALPLNVLIDKLKGLAGKKAGSGMAIPVDETYVACGETSSIPGTHLCIFNNDAGMNFALNRASQFIEAKAMLDHAGLERLNFKMNVQGHNLAGDDLRNFASAYAKVKAGFDRKVPPLDKPEFFNELGNGLGLEREFWDSYLNGKLASPARFYLLAVTVDGASELNHEVLHALYASRPEMQAIVTAFWKELSLAERKDIIEEIASSGTYDVGQDNPDAPSFLLLNEFQAYVLMERNGSGDHLFADLGVKYKDRLSQKLAKQGIELPNTKVKASAAQAPKAEADQGFE